MHILVKMLAISLVISSFRREAECFFNALLLVSSANADYVGAKDIFVDSQLTAMYDSIKCKPAYFKYVL